MTSPAKSTLDKTQVSIPEWRAIVAKYEQPSTWRASWQIINTI